MTLQQLKEETRKEFNKECQVRWQEQGFTIMCGHEFPCPEHTSRIQLFTVIDFLIDKAYEEGKKEGRKEVVMDLEDLGTIQ